MFSIHAMSSSGTPCSYILMYIYMTRLVFTTHVLYLQLTYSIVNSQIVITTVFFTSNHAAKCMINPPISTTRCGVQNISHN